MYSSGLHVAHQLIYPFWVSGIMLLIVVANSWVVIDDCSIAFLGVVSICVGWAPCGLEVGKAGEETLGFCTQPKIETVGVLETMAFREN